METEFPRYTYKDYKNWKEDWELISGYPFQMLPSPSPKHSRVQSKFIYQGNLSLNDKNGDCNCVVFVELDWKINEETVVRPDVMVVCGDPKEDYLSFPPMLIIEILSPASMRHDRAVKFELYQEQGVPYYLMADPLRETVEVYEMTDNRYKQVEKSSFLIEKDCELTFNFDEIWK